MTKQEFRDLLLGRRIVEVNTSSNGPLVVYADGSAYLEDATLTLDDGTVIATVALHGNESALCVEPPGGSR